LNSTSAANGTALRHGHGRRVPRYRGRVCVPGEYALRRRSAQSQPSVARPRTDPDVRHSRIRLLTRVLDGEALARPRNGGCAAARASRRRASSAAPTHAILLAAPSERARHRSAPHGRQEPGHDLPQPLPLRGDRLVPPHRISSLILLEVGSHAVASDVPFHEEAAPTALTADEGKPRKLKVPGLPSSRWARRAAA
jgi:hypothetical protein